MHIRTKNIRQDSSENTAFSELDNSSCSSDGYYLLLITVLLMLIGLSILYSTSSLEGGTGLLKKQLVWGGVGFSAGLCVVLVGYKKLCSYSLLFYIGLIFLLLLPITVMKKEINGAFRWISLGSIRIQPSEFAKIVLLLFWANFLSRHFRDIENASFKKVFLPMTVSAVCIVGLVLAGKDLGTTSLLMALFFIMIFASGMSWWYTLLPAGLGALGIFTIFNPVLQEFFLKIGILPEYRIARLLSFQTPELYADKSGYQLWLSQLALGSGEWLGRGLANSRLKLQYLPEAHTDFILSIMGEELGFVSMVTVMVLYLLLVLIGLKIAYHARTRQGALIAFGVSALIGMQAFVNIGVICGALPTKGMTAPFISYGGSSLVTCMVSIALVFSVALDNTTPDYTERIRERVREFFGKTESEKSK